MTDPQPPKSFSGDENHFAVDDNDEEESDYGNGVHETYKEDKGENGRLNGDCDLESHFDLKETSNGVHETYKEDKGENGRLNGDCDLESHFDLKEFSKFVWPIDLNQKERFLDDDDDDEQQQQQGDSDRNDEQEKYGEDMGNGEGMNGDCDLESHLSLKETSKIVRQIDLNKKETFLDDDDDDEQQQQQQGNSDKNDEQETNGEDMGNDGMIGDCDLESHFSLKEPSKFVRRIDLNKKERFLDDDDDEQQQQQQGDSDKNDKQETYGEDVGNDEGMNSDRVLESNSPEYEDNDRYDVVWQMFDEEERFLDEGEQSLEGAEQPEVEIVNGNDDEEEAGDGDNNSEQKTFEENEEEFPVMLEYDGDISEIFRVEEEGDKKRRRIEYGQKKRSSEEIDLDSSYQMNGFFCFRCMEAWADSDDRHTCRLPCGHSCSWTCIIKSLQPRRNSDMNQCPQCNRECSVTDSATASDDEEEEEEEEPYQLGGEDPAAAATQNEGEAFVEPEVIRMLDSLSEQIDEQVDWLQHKIDDMEQRIDDISTRIMEVRRQAAAAATTPSSSSE